MTQLKEFAEVQYKRILQHGNTRFLSLLPALERILNIFEGLKSYFNSQEQCPAIIKRYFEEPSQEVYLRFVHGQLNLFSKTTLKMERQNISATEVANELDLLKMNVKERKDNSLIPHGAKVLSRKLEESGEISVNLSGLLRMTSVLSMTDVWHTYHSGRKVLKTQSPING